MVSKLEENIRKLVERRLMSPNALKKKDYKITYDDGREEAVHTSETARKRVENDQVVRVEMKHKNLKTNPDATGPKNCFIVGEETEWKDVTARYKK